MSVYAPLTAYTWEMLRAYGIDPEPVFRAAGIEPETAFDPDSRVTSENKIELQKLACTAANDEAYGVRHTEVFHPSHLGPLGYAWMSSGTLREALGLLRRYSRLLSHQFVISFGGEREESYVGFHWLDAKDRPPTEHFGTLAVMVHMCRLIAGWDFKPVRVECVPDAPSDPRVFRDHFRCPLVFGQRLDRLFLKAEILDRRLVSGHPDLGRVHEDMVVRYLAALDEDDIVNQVRATISDLLSEGNVTISRVARQLNLTERTLRRRLHERGHSFRALLNDQRRVLGQRLVRNPLLSLTEISYLLGFSNPSAFSRAFKHWTGTPPAKARKRVTRRTD